MGGGHGMGGKGGLAGHRIGGDPPMTLVSLAVTERAALLNVMEP
jgi:hypothetical protein